MVARCLAHPVIALHGGKGMASLSEFWADEFLRFLPLSPDARFFPPPGHLPLVSRARKRHFGGIS